MHVRVAGAGYAGLVRDPEARRRHLFAFLVILALHAALLLALSRAGTLHPVIAAGALQVRLLGAGEISRTLELPAPALVAAPVITLKPPLPVATDPVPPGHVPPRVPPAGLPLPAPPADGSGTAHEDATLLALFVLEDGSVDEVLIVHSCGSAALDQFAVNWAKARWRLLPGMDNRRPTAMWFEYAVRWQGSRG